MNGANCERLRRICSVVPPKLGIEHTEIGSRTVVLDCQTADALDAETLLERMATNNSQHAYQEGFSPRSVSFVNVKRDQKRHGRRLRFSSFLPSETPCRERTTLTVIGRDCLRDRTVQGQMEEGDMHPVRKTQRSISVHSAALPAPDCSILKDCRTGKIYKRGKLLGKGGFAKVYEGLEVSTGKRFALKIFDKLRLTYPHQRDRMHKEIDMHFAASEASHPNVAKFETMFENSRSLCLVIELCENRSLAQHLRRKGFLSECEVSDFLWQIVCGLSHIHGCGIIHRDLKLGNILLSGDTVKIADFGLATGVSWEQQKTVCGTPNFIAPEVLRRQGHGPEADIWSLGCIVYTLLVGKPPFESTSLKDTYKFILRNSYTIPSSLSDEAVDLIRWMLKAKPRNRPSLCEVLNHVFFLKHETQARFSSIEDLSTDFPPKRLEGEYRPQQRRRSAAPEPVSQLCSTSCTECLRKVRNNSCPAVSVRDDSSYAIGPKLTLFISMEQVQATSKARFGADESSPGVANDCSIMANLGKFPTNIENTPSPHIKDNLAEFLDQRISSKNHWCGLQKVSESKGVKKFGKRAKGSPVKSIASKLQKFRFPSPTNCMTKTTGPKMRDEGNVGSGLFSSISASKADCQATWVTKWVDYSNKYGFGYQLSNGKTCVLLNNGSHIALLPDRKTIEYIEYDGSAFDCTTVFNVRNNPAAQVVKILLFFVSYMENNLRRGSATASVIEEMQEDSTRMLMWSRTTDRIAMYISNGTLQVNFCDDHTKINVSNIHENSYTTVTFVDKSGEVMTYGRNELSNPGMIEPRRRLHQAHEEFHYLLEKGHCISHPFCALFAHSIGPAVQAETVGTASV